jgi:putative transposase
MSRLEPGGEWADASKMTDRSAHRLEVLPKAQWQRRVVHFYRNVFSPVPSGKVRDIAKMLKAIHAQDNRKAAAEKMAADIADLRAKKLT